LVKNPNDLPLDRDIMPTIMIVQKEFYKTLAVKLFPENTSEALMSIEKEFKSVFPDEPFKYEFLEEIIEANYSDQLKLGMLFTVFTGLAILIAGMGIFGLSSFTAEQRTKEIGIRKVMGASVPHIVRLMTTELVILAAISSIAALPIAYYFMIKWLQDFAFQTDIGIMLFVISIVFSLLIALGATGFQALRAASSDPVKSLRYE